MTDTTLTLTVESRSEIRDRFVAAMQGVHQGHFVTFMTATDLIKTLSKSRLAIVEAMIGGRSMSIEQLAAVTGRQEGLVEADVHALVHAGILKEESGFVMCPYSGVHVDFRIGPPPKADPSKIIQCVVPPT
jgi:predicted transcriptional regulator